MLNPDTIHVTDAAGLIQERIMRVYNRANTWADHPSYDDRGALMYDIRAIDAVLDFLYDATGGNDPEGRTFSTSVVAGVDIAALQTFTTAMFDAKNNVDYRNGGRAVVTLQRIFYTRVTRPLFH